MAKFLVFSELYQDDVKNVTKEILGRLDAQSKDVLIIGDVPDKAKQELAQHGAGTIFSLQSDQLTQYSPDAYAKAIQNFLSAKDYNYLLAGATSLGKDMLPRLSALLETGLASDAIDIQIQGDDLKGTRPLFAGKCLADFELQKDRLAIVSVRPNALGLPENPSAGEGKLEEVSAEIEAPQAQVKEIIAGSSDKADLTEANIIVSGGRSLKAADNFKILDELASVIGATVGASRAAVDSGYAPHSMQVGQTGKTVSPSLYVACGISGAIQHLAGMRTSKVIVAINSDPDAPIFSKADYGIVGDLFNIVPLMTEEFKKVMS